MSRHIVSKILVCMVAASALSSQTIGDDVVAVAQTPPNGGRFYYDSRAELALARARGDRTVMIAIAAREGATENVARAIKEAGGTVQYRHDEVSYLRVEVPLDRADTVANDVSVEAATVDVSATITRPLLANLSDDVANEAVSSSEQSALEPARQQPHAWPPPWSDYPLTNPYSPLSDISAAELRRLHPTYDGRGITIGHVETAVDLLLPEFEIAYTLDGRPTQKIVDIRSALDPDHDHRSASGRTPWVLMKGEVSATGGRFTTKDDSYVTPRDGRFRFGMFDGQRVCDNLTRRNPEAPPPPPISLDEPQGSDPACSFGVLWNEQTNEVWLDTNRDRSFAEERPLTDFRVRRDIGTIGKDEPETIEREMFAFTVQTDPKRRAVAIHLGDGSHATMVAGSAAGSRGTRGRYDGVASGAQLVIIDYGGACVGGVIEGLIDAFSDPRIDVVLFEQNVWIAHPYRLGDGRFPATIVTSRLIEKYKKPFIVPADNTPGVNAVSEHGNAQWGFAIGAYEAKESYRINDGYLVEHDDNLHHVGSWGPSGLGAIKPDVLAPSGYLSSEIPTGRYARDGVKGLYRLPPGYGIGGGTSQATPTMAGAVALLMSAAKQEKVPYDAERIWRAMTNSARYIPHLPAHKQGHGVVQVAAALELLKAYAKTPPAITIETRAPVRTQYSGSFVRPHEGVGLWEQQGWRAGQRAERAVTFTRTTGPREPITFTLSWQGNNGTFSSPSAVTLPLGTPVTVAITIAPRSWGTHSALLTLDHPTIPGHAHRMMATIVAAEPFAAADKFVIEKKDTLERPGPFTSYYVDVPRGAGALILSPMGAGLSILDPIGRRPLVGSGGRVVTLPTSGVWELVVRITNDSLDLAWMGQAGEVVPRVPYALNASVVGAWIETPSSLSIAEGASLPVDVTVTNAFGAFDGGLTSIAIGAVRTMNQRLGPRQQLVFDLLVPEGSPLLAAEVTAVSGNLNDVDLYLFDCTGEQCRPGGSALGLGSPPRLRRANPKPGLWKVVLDGNQLPEGGATVEYTDVVADPSLGVVAVADGSRRREPAARWTVKANVWLAKRPEMDRLPQALFLVNATKDGSMLSVALRRVPMEVRTASKQP